MITLESRDSYIWNFAEKIIEIIKESQHTEKIIISMNQEGPCLRSCGLYDFLDLICDNFEIKKSRFEIYTANVEEFHNEYQICIVPNVWLGEIKKYSAQVATKQSNLIPIGCFVGKVNWSRLLLLSWLDKFPNKSILTCHYNAEDLTSQSALQLNEIAKEFPQELQSVAQFIDTCPRLTTDPVIPYHQLRNLNLEQIANISAAMITNYDKIFCELICETYFSGFTFFPTEKTFRPIQQLTPFVIFGPVGFLENLKRIGFKTFDRWWDESYDTCSAAERISKIQTVLLQLFQYSKTELNTMYQDMQPVLMHNKQRLAKLQPVELLFDEQR